jgi:DNA-binding NtrC family response regulator
MLQTQKLLLIDDEPGVLRALALLLSTMAFDVKPFGSPVEAVGYILTTEEIDLVVTDLRMPELSGDEVVKKVRALRPSLPVIVMSGHANPQDIATLRQNGATAFLPKPFSPQQFKTAIAEMEKVRAVQKATRTAFV